MNKKRGVILAALFGLLGIFGLVQKAGAANTADITVTVTVQKISLTVSDASVAFGTLAADSDIVVADTTTVNNDGNIQESYQLSATHPVGSLAQNMTADPGPDEFDLLAAFDNTINDVTNAALTAGAGTGDSLQIGGSALTATANRFAKDSEGTGFSVPKTEDRYLFFLFRAPKTNSHPEEQSFTVTVTAIAG